MSDSASHTAALEIAHSYDFQGPSIELGAIVVDGEVNSDAQVRIPLAMMNRHGLVAGATGTGKTKTLQKIAEQLSEAGVPVLLADIKGDLSGLYKPGEADDHITSRAKETGDDWKASAYPVEFTSIGAGGIGVPLRATVASFGPILLSKVLGLNDTQESTLSLVFKWAKDKSLELYDLKDLRAVLSYLTSDEGKGDLTSIGGVSKQTAGVILRAITVLEGEGGDTFFGEPEIKTEDLLQTRDGKGVITLFELANQASKPKLFSTFLMWILADLFATLPEVGDVDKPKAVFIFDEAHTLFNEASKAFKNTIEQTVKLIRSKGVGIFFCSQLPTDIPNEVLSQLGARIQHALRAFTPDDQKALAKTVKTFPTTKAYTLDSALTSLGIGEAIVTVLSEKGAPTAVAWTRIRPPHSFMGEIGSDKVQQAAQASPLWARYSQPVDRPSAFEKLQPSLDAGNKAPQTKSGGRGSSQRSQGNTGGVLTSISRNPLFKSVLNKTIDSFSKQITKTIFGKK